MSRAQKARGALRPDSSTKEGLDFPYVEVRCWETRVSAIQPRRAAPGNYNALQPIEVAIQLAYDCFPHVDFT